MGAQYCGLPLTPAFCVLLTILTLVCAEAVLLGEHSDECVPASGDGAAPNDSYTSCVQNPLFPGDRWLENGSAVQVQLPEWDL